MKVNNPTEIKFPFNVNNEKQFNHYINRLDKLGYIRICFDIRGVRKQYPIRFTCISKENKQYLIY